MSFPVLKPGKTGDPSPTDSVVLAVYAPFGTDETLSHYPDGNTQQIVQHPLYHVMLKVAECGVHVCGLVDLAGDDTWIIEIPAGQPADVMVRSRWKQDMAHPETLAGFLRHVHKKHPSAAIVLTMEGHGAGYLPEIDPRALTARRLTTSENGTFGWNIGPANVAPVNADGSPLLPMGCPLLPMGCPLLPVNALPLSNWGIAAGLKAARDQGVPKISVIHFNNCFNMSVELLHTISPYAEYAAGYCNYNFFTAGIAYPPVFRRLKQDGSASTACFARWLTQSNHAVLASKHNHPTIGGVVELARMREIGERIDDLSDALLSALRSATPAERPTVVNQIRDAIKAAQQYDTEAGYGLETPDELTDIMSLAVQLQVPDFGKPPVRETAAALEKSLVGIKVYGDDDRPWVDTGEVWNFTDKSLAMNIFLPDPSLIGVWDWRSPYYLVVNPDPTPPVLQPAIIDFLKDTDWVDFLIELHKDVKFAQLLPPSIPEFPVFNRKFVPPRDGGGDDPKPPPPSDPPPPPPPPPFDPKRAA